MGKDPGFRERLPEADHVAFQALFQKFYRPLLGFFIKRGCSESEAEDLVQETLLNAYRGFESFRGDASAATWIFSIAGNLWLNQLRSQSTLKRNVRPVSLEHMDDTDPEVAESATGSDGDPSALERILENERRAQLHQAMRRLPEGRRHALHLRVVHGLKYREIASLMKIEVNTVKSQISQAKKQLEATLAEAPTEQPTMKESP